MGTRSSKVIVSPEGRVLKQLREKHGLSMKAAGTEVGISASMISHIENGRNNPPKGELLDKLLALYGGIGRKYFYDLSRSYQEKTTDADFICEHIDQLNPEKQKLLRAMMATMLEQK